MKTVTICGSMRFSEAMQRIAWELETNRGWNVLQCVYDPVGADISEEMLQRLEKAHYRKIDLSDAIYVVNIGGYTGQSVRKEIDYAKAQGKEILFHE